MRSITPELLVESLQESLQFYIESLGFKVITSFPEDGAFFAIVENGDCKIMLYERKQFIEEIPKYEEMITGGTIALFINLENVTELYNNISNSVKIIQQLHDTSYGTKEFSCEDNNGYVLIFAEDI